jgi:hypothetical protein
MQTLAEWKAVLASPDWRAGYPLNFSLLLDNLTGMVLVPVSDRSTKQKGTLVKMIF